MVIKDKRWNGKELDISHVYNFPSAEQETTIAYYRTDSTITVYSSNTTDITKILKITDHDNVKVLSVSDSGVITAIQTELDTRQVHFRNIPKKVERSQETIDKMSAALARYRESKN